MLNDEEKKYLLRIARASVEAAVAGSAAPDLHTTDQALLEDRGAFVTLKRGGELRGCLGYVEGSEPLIRAVAENAAAAALRDTRFTPVRASELAEISIEVSALTPLKLVEDADAIEVGQHGLMICLGPNRGLLLPQVGEEWGWDREQFLAQTCNKAGLAPDEWHNPQAQLFSFEAEVFGEADYPELMP
jgi:AmmeMemoRadiSam system protein A